MHRPITLSKSAHMTEIALKNTLPALPDFMGLLANVLRARQSATEYYDPLLSSEDEVLVCGAWCALIARREIPLARFDQLPAASRHGAVKRAAATMLEAVYEHDLALQCLAMPSDSVSEAEIAALKAEIELDVDAQIDAAERTYLANGDQAALVAATKIVESKGWKQAAAWACRLVAIAPHHPKGAFSLFHILDQANQADLLETAIAYFRAAGIHQYSCLVFEAAVTRLRGKYQDCLSMLRNIEKVRATVSEQDAARMHPLFLRLAAESRDKVGDYKGSYATYVMLNKIDMGEKFDPDAFYTGVRTLAKLTVPGLPADGNTNHFSMLGFPRSGTTLLENVLGAHPLIETFEEIPSGAAMVGQVQIHMAGGDPRANVTAAMLKARQSYYAEITRRARKATAQVFVDKLPIRSADAAFLRKIFPDKRHLFSIRHPFDVVLSCFRQKFNQNAAMIHFNTIDSAVKLYDFTMTQWFEHYGLDDPHVHYIRYDELVTDFDRVTRGAIAFLGVEWDDRVVDFASVAETRAAKTPSYQKVRKGLSIGVQTYWRNYGFLFQSPEAKPLHKWAEFFGYPTK
ncbi:MAG: sulfotransferase [Devosia sp.]